MHKHDALQQYAECAVFGVLWTCLRVLRWLRLMKVQLICTNLSRQGMHPSEQAIHSALGATDGLYTHPKKNGRAATNGLYMGGH